jgi:LysR family transcriptional regulator for metE and metH
VFGYDLVLVVHEQNRLAGQDFISPADLQDETLITYPVGLERLDIYTRFLVPAHCRPSQHTTVETTELMLQLVAAGRGVTVLPEWLVREEGGTLPIRTVKLGEAGIQKQLNLGIRCGDEGSEYVAGFLGAGHGEVGAGKPADPARLMPFQPNASALGSPGSSEGLNHRLHRADDDDLTLSACDCRVDP